MINEDSIAYFNSRLTVDLNQLKKMSSSQLDQVRTYGSQAEAMLKNREFAMFVHHYKFQLADELTAVRGHQLEDDRQRVAISQQLVGIDEFINMLKKAVYFKSRIGNTNEVPDA